MRVDIRCARGTEGLLGRPVWVFFCRQARRLSLEAAKRFSAQLQTPGVMRLNVMEAIGLPVNSDSPLEIAARKLFQTKSRCVNSVETLSLEWGGHLFVKRCTPAAQIGTGSGIARACVILPAHVVEAFAYPDRRDGREHAQVAREPCEHAVPR